MIAINQTKRKLLAGERAIGLGVSLLRGAAVPMIAKAAGLDWLFIDREHGALTEDDAAQLCIAALAYGVTPVVRVCSGSIDEATRALDTGAQGVVVPHVDTPEQAGAIAAALRFPPRGGRSWGGGAAVWGLRPPAMAQAMEEADEQLLLAVMIETTTALAHADAIASVPGVDVLLVGSSDLSISMGIAGQFGHPLMRSAYDTLAQACVRHGKALGLGGIYDEALACDYIRAGCRFIIAGHDQGLILNAATSRAALLRGA
ncbi:MAG: aldolase [Rhodospirillales bacterium]|nr:aldolase [Rhodospirillales bacterium]